MVTRGGFRETYKRRCKLLEDPVGLLEDDAVGHHGAYNMVTRGSCRVTYRIRCKLLEDPVGLL